ncbi:MAG: hypothetical protein HKO62_00915 [Gammaproteobacteria bacterium]|nr:hypothetical protein [Gammaproteobacteria bacterium]NNL99277.1 hypothetical protein [Gammaproteobacteria bacterium]
MTAVDYLVVVVFGWPAALLGVFLVAVGLGTRRAGLVLAGGISALGFCAYIAMNPTPARWLGLAAIAGNLLSALALRRRRPAIAAIAALPYLVLIVHMARIVILVDGT